MMKFFLRNSTKKKTINSNGFKTDSPPGHAETYPQKMECSIRSSSGGSDVFARKQRRQLTQPLLLSDEEEKKPLTIREIFYRKVRSN